MATNNVVFPLKPQPVSTATTTALATGTIRPYNASAGALAPVLPSLANVVDDDYLIVEKDVLDTSWNPISVTCAGSDKFASGASVANLTRKGDRVEIQAATVSGTRVWKLKHHSFSRSSLDLDYGRFKDGSQVQSSSRVSRQYTAVVGYGATGAFDNGFVESPCVFWDPATEKLAMVYTGYSKVVSDSTTVGSIGLAYSDDGINWTKSAQIFTPSGNSGDPDSASVTGPVIVYDAGLYHLFYIGCTQTGYEQGNKTICHATATSLTGPWTRLGAAVTKGAAGTFRSQYVWHPNLAFAKGQWYMFFNATNDANVERAGYATAPTLNGPWTVDDTNSPIVPDAGHTTDKIWGGDPFVWRDGNVWRLEFWRADSAYTTTEDWYATTTDDAFPLGWTVQARTTQGTALSQPTKPWVIRLNGRLFHYGSYSGVSLMTMPDLEGQVNRTISGIWRFNPTTDGQGTSATAIFGTHPGVGGLSGTTKVMHGNTAADCWYFMGQDSSHMGYFRWTYNATPANASWEFGTWGGSNPIYFQPNGKLVIGNGGSGSDISIGNGAGKIGFFGGASTTKPSLTYSRATENAAQTQLRTVLVSLGLASDNTTA